MLRDRFVCGIANPVVQKRLVSEPDLAFTKAVSIAEAAELADKGSKEIRASPGDLPENIHKFSHVTNSVNSSQKRIDVLLQKTDCLLEPVIAVVVNTIIQHALLSLKCAIFVRNEATLPRYVEADHRCLRIKLQLQWTAVNLPTK